MTMLNNFGEDCSKILVRRFNTEKRESDLNLTVSRLEAAILLSIITVDYNRGITQLYRQEMTFMITAYAFCCNSIERQLSKQNNQSVNHICLSASARGRFSSS